MIRLIRRRLLLAVLALFLAGVGTIAWTLAGLPPVKYYLRYGLDPYCAPTGERMTLEGMEFVEVGPGIFRMGSTANAEGGDWLGKLSMPFGLPWGKQPEPSDEMPVHWVEFRRGFWIATTEVTNAQYERFRPKNERSEYSKGDDTPVIGVSRQDAKEYCAWLSRKSGRAIRLPSEAEWECACRAGSKDEFTFGDDEELLSEFAWYDQNSKGCCHAVAKKLPNRWGLFDLHGNVWEWCEDSYHGSYRGAPSDGSAWTTSGLLSRSGQVYHVVRGGCWDDPAERCSHSHRWYRSRHRGKFVGTRLAAD